MPNPITYKCVICGAEIESIGRGMGKCPSCNFRQSMPTVSSQKLDRANKFRRDEHDFKKALKLYEEVTEETPEEADAFWGAAICKYGVEFVNDEAEDVVPTFYQTNKFRFSGMPEFKAACEKADDEQKSFYERTAQKIDNAHRKIIDIFAAKKFSAEVYIRCCTDENNIVSEEIKKDAGKIASRLREKDYIVFSPNTESSGGDPGSAEYESFVYNGLSKAGIMLIIGNKPEQFTNKWLKNEWTRFNIFHKENKQCIIIPVVFDMDPYELPMELQSTQAIDWHSAEAMDLVLEAVDKAMGRYVDNSTRKNIEHINNIINEQDKKKADQLYEKALKLTKQNASGSAEGIIQQILNIDPEYHKAYWLRLCLKMNTTPDKIQNLRLDITNNPDYISALHYADDDSFKKYEDIKNKCFKNLSLQQNYNNEIKNLMNSCCQMQNSQIIDIGKKNTLEQSINNALKSQIYTAKTYSNFSVACCAVIFVLKVILLLAGLKIGRYMNLNDSISISKGILIMILFYAVSALYYISLLINILPHQFCTGNKLLGTATAITQIVLSVACSGCDYKGLIQVGPMLSMTLRYNNNTGTEYFMSFWNFVIIDLLVAAFFLCKYIPVTLREASKKKSRQKCEQNYNEYCSLLNQAAENLENAKRSIFEKYNSFKDSPECILEPVTDKSFEIICEKLKHSYDGQFVVKVINIAKCDYLKDDDNK